MLWSTSLPLSLPLSLSHTLFFLPPSLSTYVTTFLSLSLSLSPSLSPSLHLPHSPFSPFISRPHLEPFDFKNYIPSNDDTESSSRDKNGPLNNPNLEEELAVVDNKMRKCRNMCAVVLKRSNKQPKLPS